MLNETVSSWLSHSDNHNDNPAGPLFVAGTLATEESLTDKNAAMNIITSKTTMTCTFGSCLCC
ncbi:MAG TPA: DUF6229 family protein [Dyella sp.]|uniref:DUF6229 family protein n=1 Tax=Dyella sp. TaxID=1869338 RepID=UPI002F946EA6